MQYPKSSSVMGVPWYRFSPTCLFCWKVARWLSVLEQSLALHPSYHTSANTLQIGVRPNSIQIHADNLRSFDHLWDGNLRDISAADVSVSTASPISVLGDVGLYQQAAPSGTCDPQHRESHLERLVRGGGRCTPGTADTQPESLEPARLPFAPCFPIKAPDRQRSLDA